MMISFKSIREISRTLFTVCLCVKVFDACRALLAMDERKINFPLVSRQIGAANAIGKPIRAQHICEPAERANRMSDPNCH